ncbi:hypothetical protein SAMN05877838_1701 [Hoeflea halophila]|uniref:Uncharacterized protein n=1 Tax=Hoeflea halophila TaxID=714899 RepID=A0A286IBR9_9HYPH|nr:hypothetical protein [Hoeflea halophila]SOE16819.1 hypothetical protein SAMN05877838_1701 [Hoeflea halophila]
MTVKLFSRKPGLNPGRRPIQAAIIFAASVGLATTALAIELKPPSGTSKLLRDKDVTVIIIDRDDGRSSSRIRLPGQSASSPLKQPSTKIRRDGDHVEIRVKRDSSGGGTFVRSGPKVIIVDSNTSSCGDSSGVCVIRH